MPCVAIQVPSGWNFLPMHPVHCSGGRSRELCDNTMKVRTSRCCLRLDPMPRRFWRCLSELDQSLFHDQASDSVLVPLGQDGARLRTRQPLKLPNNSDTLVTTTANSLREGTRNYPPNKTLTAVRVLVPDRNSLDQLSHPAIALSINP